MQRCYLQLAQEVRDQKRDEARMLAEALLDAEMRIGELFKLMPKATKGTGSNQYQTKSAENDTAVGFSKPKSEAIRELGFSPKQAERFETLASHPEEVERIKAEARENDDLPTRTNPLA